MGTIIIGAIFSIVLVYGIIHTVNQSKKGGCAGCSSCKDSSCDSKK